MTIYDRCRKIGPDIDIATLNPEVAEELRIRLRTARELGQAFLLGWVEDDDTLWIGAIPEGDEEE